MSSVNRYSTIRLSLRGDPRDGRGGGKLGAFVVVARSDDLLEAVDDQLLSLADEARRRQLVRKRDRDDFTAARVLALLLMGFLHDTSATEYEIHQSCEVCGGRHGRPTIANPNKYDVSWSHDQGVVAAAVGPGRIGVDVLVSTQRVRGRELRSVTTPTLSIEAITRIEALVKVGAGTLDDLVCAATRHPGEMVLQNAYVSDNNRRVRMQSSDVDGAVVSVASSTSPRFVPLHEILY